MTDQTNFRRERIEKLLHELRYEIEREMLEADIGETMDFRFCVPLDFAAQLRVRFPVDGLELGRGAVANNPDHQTSFDAAPRVAGLSFASCLDGDTASEMPRNGAVDPRVFNITKASYGILEAARLLSLSKSHIYREIAAGKLRRTKRRGRALLLAPDLIEYLTQPQEVT